MIFHLHFSAQQRLDLEGHAILSHYVRTSAGKSKNEIFFEEIIRQKISQRENASIIGGFFTTFLQLRRNKPSIRKKIRSTLNSDCNCVQQEDWKN